MIWKPSITCGSHTKLETGHFMKLIHSLKKQSNKLPNASRLHRTQNANTLLSIKVKTNNLYNTMHANLKSILHQRTLILEIYIIQSSFPNIETSFSAHLNQTWCLTKMICQTKSLYSEHLWQYTGYYIIPTMSICTAIQWKTLRTCISSV